jgi:hypothetical protein
VYDIQKGNKNDEIKLYMGYNEEKGKSREDSLELRIFIFYSSPKSSVLSRGIPWVSW